MSFKAYLFDKSIRPPKKVFYQSKAIVQKNYEEKIKKMYLRDLELSERSLIEPEPSSQIHQIETNSDTYFFPTTDFGNSFNGHSVSSEPNTEPISTETDSHTCPNNNDFYHNDDTNDLNILLSKLTTEEETAPAMLAYFFGSNLSQNGF